MEKNGLIVVAGAGGFIAGALVRYFKDNGFTRIRAIDKKPLREWYRVTPGVESLCLDLSDQMNCRRATESVTNGPATEATSAVRADTMLMRSGSSIG